MKHEIQITQDITIVTTMNEFGYDEVIDTFQNSEKVFIVTYNIASESHRLNDELRKLSEDCKLTIITNIPGRFDKYFGDKAKISAKKAIDTYINSVNPSKFSADTASFFNFNNHSKIIMTEYVAYIGSSNFSDASQNNFESGVIFRDKGIIEQIEIGIIPLLTETAIEYIGDIHNKLVLSVSNLISKLDMYNSEFHYSFYGTIEHRGDILGEYYGVNNAVLDSRLLENLNSLIAEISDELNRYAEIENFEWIYDFIDESLYSDIEQIIQCDSKLEEFAAFDEMDSASDFLEEHSLYAYDEYLEDYAQSATEFAGYELENLLIEVRDDVERLELCLSNLKQTLKGYLVM